MSQFSENVLAPAERWESTTVVTGANSNASSLASRWARLGAFVADSLFALMLILPGAFLGYDAYYDDFSTGGMALVLLGAVAVMAIQWPLIATRGQSVGKMLMGIKIVRTGTHDAPGFGRGVLLRTALVNLISNLPFGIGPIAAVVDLLAIFGGDRRCLHDLLADTEVIKA